MILIICWAVLALGLAAASPSQSNTEETVGKGSPPPQAVASITPASKANDPERLNAPCRQGEIDRTSDLCAQWYAADSAHEGAVWARRTGWFTGLGLIVGAITMVAAIFAALYAKEAAKHTKAGADAAHQANRPWLTVSVNPNFVVTNNSPIFSLLLTIKNIGRTPAQNVRYEAEIIKGGSHAGDHEFFSTPHKDKNRPRTNRAVLPDGSFTDQELVFTTWETLEANGIALIGVNVTYSLPDGTTAQTSVSYHVGMATDDPGRLDRVVPNMRDTEGLLRADPAWFEKYT
jgi:hypothetical protein